METFGATFGVLNWVIVGIYLICNLCLGWLMGRKMTTASDYFIGNQTAPWWAIGLSVMATYVSALSFLGGPAWAYGDGMAALAININYPLVVFVCIVFFIPFFYQSGVASIYDYLERRFGVTTRRIISLTFMGTNVLGSASILTATAIVVSFATGLPPIAAIIVIATIVLAYTILGGMNAVIWTDVLQGIVLLCGAVIVLFFLLNETAPLANALAYLEADNRLDPLNYEWDFAIAPTAWAGIIAMTLYHITVYGTNQMMVQRALAAKSIGDAKKSYMLMGHGAFILYFIFFFTGALLYVHYDAAPFDQPNAIILHFTRSLAIPGMLGLIAAAILSASMSSLSSSLNSLATVTMTDFHLPLTGKSETIAAPDMKHFLALSRIYTLLWAMLIIPVALSFIASRGSILETLAAVGSYLVGAKLAAFGMGFFSKHTTERGMIIGVIAGFVSLVSVSVGLFGLGPYDIAWPWYVVIGGGVNMIVAWGASLILDGRAAAWHPYSVPGQWQAARAEKREIQIDGWYTLPGKVERATWMLLLSFAAIMVFLTLFARAI